MHLHPALSAPDLADLSALVPDHVPPDSSELASLLGRLARPAFAGLLETLASEAGNEMRPDPAPGDRSPRPEPFTLADMPPDRLRAPAGTAVLLRTSTVEVVVRSWTPGSSTRAHDHGGAPAACAVVTGSLVEDRFAEPVWRSSPERRRLPAGTVVPLAADTVHVLANPGPTGALTLHAQVPGAGTRWRSAGASGLLAEAMFLAAMI